MNRNQRNHALEQVRLEIKNKASDAPEVSKKRPRSDTHRMTFGIAIVVACCVVVPYFHYAMKINKFSSENCPQWFHH